MVRAAYYRADSENGDCVDDPSEDALFMLVDDLDDADNTFVVIQPDEADPAWFVSVAVLEEGGYEVVRRDVARREHQVSTAAEVGEIARDLTIWMTERAWSGRAGA
ncbi:hypothetical protein [Streptomyces sp. NPDC059009]|uniref:hypothetical protein n=1 Tax=Streptomyces sp. NPDC059009 TaxID=3346694 RepID=UPI003677F192